jgi:hypothetical protein
MLKTLFRTSVAALAAASIGFCALPAVADGVGDVMSTDMVNGANTAIRNAMDRARLEKQKLAQQKIAPGTVAQAPPISQQPIGPEQELGLPTGFTYTADLSVAYPFGNIGTTGKQWLPGGGDISLAYGFNPTTRVVASLFQLQHWPQGFNTGIHPVYLNGFVNPVGCVDIGSTTGSGKCSGINPINIATKDQFVVLMGEQLFVLPLPGNKALPFVVSPLYVSRTGQIGQSGNGTDEVPFGYNPPDGPTFSSLHARTAQVMSLGVTVPFLKTPAMFGTFTVSPTWLVHTAGINTGNSAQLYQVLYLEYTPNNSKTTFFFEPQSARDYLPTDPYPEHLIAYFAGVSQRLTKWSFVQFVLNSGGPTNEGPYGVTAIMAPTVTCLTKQNCPVVTGGLKATQFQLQFGVGSPSVIPL